MADRDFDGLSLFGGFYFLVDVDAVMGRGKVWNVGRMKKKLKIVKNGEKR